MCEPSPGQEKVGVPGMLIFFGLSISSTSTSISLMAVLRKGDHETSLGGEAERKEKKHQENTLFFVPSPGVLHRDGYRQTRARCIYSRRQHVKLVVGIREQSGQSPWGLERKQKHTQAKKTTFIPSEDRGGG